MIFFVCNRRLITSITDVLRTCGALGRVTAPRQGATGLETMTRLAYLYSWRDAKRRSRRWSHSATPLLSSSRLG